MLPSWIRMITEQVLYARRLTINIKKNIRHGREGEFEVKLSSETALKRDHFSLTIEVPTGTEIKKRMPKMHSIGS